MECSDSDHCRHTGLACCSALNAVPGLNLIFSDQTVLIVISLRRGGGGGGGGWQNWYIPIASQVKSSEAWQEETNICPSSPVQSLQSSDLSSGNSAQQCRPAGRPSQSRVKIWASVIARIDGAKYYQASLSLKRDLKTSSQKITKNHIVKNKKAGQKQVIFNVSLLSENRSCSTLFSLELHSSESNSRQV